MENADDSKIMCEVCNINFTEKKNLYAHMRRKHGENSVVLTKTKQVCVCDICGKQFATKFTLTRHQNQIHASTSSETERKSRIKCPCETCMENYKTHEQMRDHLQNDHGINIEHEDYEFESTAAFLHWKNCTEEENLSSYVLSTASKILSDSSKKLFYNCHRSYNHVSSGKGLRSLKNIGSNKIGSACPSRMEVVEKNEGTVSVKYWKTHLGHSLDIGRIFLSKRTRAEIAGKLKEGVTFTHILDEIRNAGLTEESQRILLLEKKDMHNIVRDFHISYSTKRHHNDAVSVKLWVEEMKQLGDECPVLLYKEQGVKSDLAIFSDTDFALIIMTSFQAQQLKQFGHDKICIDGTHGTNNYDFQLFTVMVIDEFGTGSPVAFCFSNRADQSIFMVLFEQIKTKVGVITTNVFMSDDAPAFYNAWHHIMSSVPNRLLCTWHVDRNWRHNLSKVTGGSEKKALVYKALRVLLQETSIEHFSDSLSQFLIDLNEDSETKLFGQYFRDNYANRPKCWAYCYRLGLGINTNMYLESLHKTLKYVYLEGKKVKRLDKSIDAVMKIARDSAFNRLIRLFKKKPTDKIRRIKESHVTSLNIKSDMINQVNNNEFIVTSTNKQTEYLVVKVGENCLDNCLRCHECKICLHSFKCSCVDNIIKLNICKHIHACSKLCFTDSQPGGMMYNESSDTVESVLAQVAKSNQAERSQGNEIKRRAEFIISLCDSSVLTENEFNSVVNKLDNVIDLLNKNTIKLEPKEMVNTNKNIAQQVRLFSTKKKKVKEHDLKKPTILEEQNIADSLLNRKNETINIHARFDHTYTE